MRFFLPSGREAWARFTRLGTRGSSERWRSRSCRNISPLPRNSGSASSGRPRRSPSSRIPTSVRSTTWAIRTVSSTWSWSTWRERRWPSWQSAGDIARGEVAHLYPAFLPDGRHFVFAARNVDPEKTSIMSPIMSASTISTNGRRAGAPRRSWFERNTTRFCRRCLRAGSAGRSKASGLDRGGQMQVWNRSGSELFYAAGEGMLMSVAMRLAAGRLAIFMAIFLPI